MAILLVFIIGYACIAFEHKINVNKTAAALITGALCWAIYMVSMDDKALVTQELQHHLGSISEILFFLLGAMTIVELIDAHDGFDVIAEKIKTNSIQSLLWRVSFITFFCSSILDNLTTTIIMISLLKKIISDRETRLLFAGIIIIAANAGGAWTPIGDVTTTMLWIGGQITAGKIVVTTFLASMTCLLIPTFITSLILKNVSFTPINSENETKDYKAHAGERRLILMLGVGTLIMIPIIKSLLHLPPYLIMLFGLGVLWVVSEILHKEKDDEDKNALSVIYALRKIDTSSILFFLGILLCIATLEATHILTSFAAWLTATIGNESIIVIFIGLLSAVIDNVPLVAAAQGMYSLSQYPTDSYFWEFLAYAAGTGGSCLIIGSAAGVTAMGMEKIEFFWYIKRISILALLGYLGGCGMYMLQYTLTH
jgi:Na+/H+ antiporter NhaD/arsenite permease-like protein